MRVEPGWRVTFRADVGEMSAARWYRIYVVSFTLLFTVFLVFGLTESKVLGFTGLGRTLVTFIQLCLVATPIFCLVTTSRAFVSDRESGVWEYALALPVSLRAFYWGKALSRVIMLALPAVLTVVAVAVLGLWHGVPVPWFAVLYYQALLTAMIACFVGLALLISILASSQEVALTSAFVVWFAVEALIDGLLLGFLVKEALPARLVMGLALLNPLQAFRVAALSLFDPQLIALGPVSFTLLEDLGRGVILAWALAWPALLGLLCAWLGSWFFVRRDLI
jgi:ABC-2 type transport system permease protein